MDGTAPSQGPTLSARRVGGEGVLGQILATWVNDSSTGVSRPKMETSTWSFCCSGLISLMVAGSVANGPSMTVTDSPTSNSTTVVAEAAGAASAAAAGFSVTAGTSRLTTSSMLSGEGLEVA